MPFPILAPEVRDIPAQANGLGSGPTNPRAPAGGVGANTGLCSESLRQMAPKHESIRYGQASARERSSPEWLRTAPLGSDMVPYGNPSQAAQSAPPSASSPTRWTLRPVDALPRGNHCGAFYPSPSSKLQSGQHGLALRPRLRRRAVLPQRRHGDTPLELEGNRLRFLVIG